MFVQGYGIVGGASFQVFVLQDDTLVMPFSTSQNEKENGVLGGTDIIVNASREAQSKKVRDPSSKGKPLASCGIVATWLECQ